MGRGVLRASSTNVSAFVSGAFAHPLTHSTTHPSSLNRPLRAHPPRYANVAPAPEARFVRGANAQPALLTPALAPGPLDTAAPEARFVSGANAQPTAHQRSKCLAYPYQKSNTRSCAKCRTAPTCQGARTCQRPTTGPFFS